MNLGAHRRTGALVATCLLLVGGAVALLALFGTRGAGSGSWRSATPEPAPAPVTPAYSSLLSAMKHGRVLSVTVAQARALAGSS